VCVCAAFLLRFVPVRDPQDGSVWYVPDVKKSRVGKAVYIKASRWALEKALKDGKLEPPCGCWKIQGAIFLGQIQRVSMYPGRVLVRPDIADYYQKVLREHACKLLEKELAEKPRHVKVLSLDTLPEMKTMKHQPVLLVGLDASEKGTHFDTDTVLPAAWRPVPLLRIGDAVVREAVTLLANKLCRMPAGPTTDASVLCVSSGLTKTATLFASAALKLRNL